MSDRTDDAALMTRVAAGDGAAFTMLAQRHIGRAHAVATRMLSSREDAEEVVQDALGRVWRHAARFDPGRSAFATWFYRIVANGCLDRLRRKVAFGKKGASIAIDDAPEIADEALSAEAALVAGDRSRAIKAAVAALPPRQRLAVVLCYFEDMPQADAARVMGMNLKAVEALLFRARQGLKPELKAVLNDD
jgi:RNA polymerase sigma-70 factor (ECF subfamily)